MAQWKIETKSVGSLNGKTELSWFPRSKWINIGVYDSVDEWESERAKILEGDIFNAFWLVCSINQSINQGGVNTSNQLMHRCLFLPFVIGRWLLLGSPDVKAGCLWPSASVACLFAAGRIFVEKSAFTVNGVFVSHISNVHTNIELRYSFWRGEANHIHLFH